jgi:methionyl aminopeptidase
VDDRNRKLTRDGIRIHDAADFDGMRRAGRLAAETLDMIADHVQPGVTTEALDQLCDRFMRDHGAVPATLGYKGYPKSSCISINHVVCHGIPGPKRLKEGDILNIDVTCILDGWYGDTSRMFVAGRLLRRAERLIEVTHDALMAGIASVRPGNRFGDIGAAIQAHVEENRMSVVRDFCGHGLGRVFHAPPNVLHFGRPGTARCWKRACSLPSNRWSIWAGPRPRCWPMTGRR